VKIARISVAVLLWLGAVQSARAQQVLLEKGVQLEGLWCFPVSDEDRTYVYLPTSLRLAEDERGRPEFSFLRYVVNTSADSGAAGLTQADGGGILHFLVILETPQATVQKARQALRQLLKDEKADLRGPLIFDDGRYALVSSIVNPTGGPNELKLLATGRAPVLEGNKLALSFPLKPQESSLLMQSFMMATPDISLVFDMTLHGLSQAYQAQLTIDWSEVRKSEGFSAGGTIYFVSADVDLMFDELRRNNAIKLTSSGSDAGMESLLTTVYNKLLELMFRPVEPDSVPADKRGGLTEAISTLLGSKNGALSSRKTSVFGISAGYQLKDLRTEGKSVLDFNHRSTVERHDLIAFNIGDMYRRYGTDTDYFRVVNIGDPAFQQREVQVVVDGTLLPEFQQLVNAVTITLRKDHQNGEQTLKEIAFDRLSAAKPSRLVYGWKGDDDRVAWLNYEYRTSWNFTGGGTYQSDWTRSNVAIVNLYAPYERFPVSVVGKPDVMQQKGVRAVAIIIEYSFFGERRKQQIVVRPDKPFDDQKFDLVVPRGQYDYDYTIVWQLEGERRLTSHGKDSIGTVFIDELPDDRTRVIGENFAQAHSVGAR
jgi:hypothetical protein